MIHSFIRLLQKCLTNDVISSLNASVRLLSYHKIFTSFLSQTLPPDRACFLPSFGKVGPKGHVVLCKCGVIFIPGHDVVCKARLPVNGRVTGDLGPPPHVGQFTVMGYT